jgi:hypothetical protein
MAQLYPSLQTSYMIDIYPPRIILQSFFNKKFLSTLQAANKKSQHNKTWTDFYPRYSLPFLLRKISRQPFLTDSSTISLLQWLHHQSSQPLHKHFAQIDPFNGY